MNTAQFRTLTDLPLSAGSQRFCEQMAALSHPARLAILADLAARDACTCKELVETRTMAQSTVSQHLRVLVDAGLVTYRQDGQRSRYGVDRQALNALSSAVGALTHHCCSGSDC
jgi:DNA-binding transcriptional ArsR family regulator